MNKKQTGMKAFEIRIVREYTELKRRCERLEKFINGDDYRRMSIAEKAIMTRQLSYMQGYLISLEDRMRYRGLI